MKKSEKIKTTTRKETVELQCELFLEKLTPIVPLNPTNPQFDNNFGGAGTVQTDFTYVWQCWQDAQSNWHPGYRLDSARPDAPPRDTGMLAKGSSGCCFL